MSEWVVVNDSWETLDVRPTQGHPSRHLLCLYQGGRTLNGGSPSSVVFVRLFIDSRNV